MLLYLFVLLVVVAWKFTPRPWHPTQRLERPHHIIFSTAKREETEDTARALEFLYTPVWWIDELATGPNLAENIRNGSVIPLRCIVTNRGGPSMSRHFNLYY